MTNGFDGVSVRGAEQARDFVGRAAPGLDEVLARGMVLTAVAFRGWAELRERSREMKGEIAARLLRWLHRHRVLESLEPDERRVLHAEVGALSEADCMSAAWRVEGAAVMAWAARIAELPRDWQLARLPDVMDAMDDVPRGAIEPGPLRPESEVLELMQGAMDLLQVLDRHREGADAGPYQRFVEDRELVERAAFERAKAARWLTGIGATYGDAAVPLGKRVLV